MSTEHVTVVELVAAFQSRAARVAVGASTVRGRGNAGVVGASRSFLRTLDLTAFGHAGMERFIASLDKTTAELREALPRNARSWGLARKVLNIFLRDCLYTTYLDGAFGLRTNEELFELPLDSITAVHLKRLAGRGVLPRWPGVRHLTAPVSAVFQEAAAGEASRRGMARVHLDAVWWSVGRDHLD